MKQRVCERVRQRTSDSQVKQLPDWEAPNISIISPGDRRQALDLSIDC